MSHNENQSRRDMSVGFRRFFTSETGRAVYPRELEHELQFEKLLPFVALQDDDKTIVTRGNELMQCIRISGLNSMTAGDDEIQRLKARVAEMIMQAGPDTSFYIHKMTRPATWSLAPIEKAGFTQELDRRWQDHLKSSQLRERTLTITVINRPSLLNSSLSMMQKLFAHNADDKQSSYQRQKAERMVRLKEIVGVVTSSLSSMNPKVLTAGSGELIGFLESIGTGMELLAYPAPDIGILASCIGNHRITFNGSRMILSSGRLPTRHGRIFAIKTYPSEPYAGMFDDLNLPLDMVVTNSWVPMLNDMALDRFGRAIRQGRSGSSELETGRKRLAEGAESFGMHQMTVAIYADDEALVESAASEVKSIAQETGTVLVSEAFAGKGHYFAQWPGNAVMRSRAGMISNRAFASIASLHRSPTGLQSSQLPWKTPLTVFPTPERAAFSFSFHPEGKPDAEPPAGHTLIFGPSGGGKSVLISMILAQARRANARIVAFDYRKGLEWQIRALGGAYSTISPAEPTGLNPLYSETDAAGQTWLADWLSELLHRADKPFSAPQSQVLSAAIRQNAEAPPELRTWDQFASLFLATADQGDLAARISEWSGTGRYSWVFGENTEDRFALDNSVLGFDLTSVFGQGQDQERTAILGYLFQRLERKMQDRRPTIIIVDEAWLALGTRYFARRLQDWFVTTRKLNAVVVLVTQYPSQLNLAEGGQSMLQAVQNQIILCNDSATADNYAALELNNRELATVLAYQGGQRLALVRTPKESVVIDLNLSALGGFLTLLGGSDTVSKRVAKAGVNPDKAWELFQ